MAERDCPRSIIVTIALSAAASPRESCVPLFPSIDLITNVSFPPSRTSPLDVHQTNLPKSTSSDRSRDRDRHVLSRDVHQEPETRRRTDCENDRESDGANVGNVERRDEEACVLCATEREGLSSRTGSMRALGMRENLGSNPAEERGWLRHWARARE